MRGAVRYLAEVYGGDGVRSLCLGGTVAPTRGLALRWLGGQALRFADGLDPGPDSAWAPPGTLWPTPHTVPDAPTQLRSWAVNVGLQEAASRRLADGVPYGFLARDASGWYRLYARPVTSRVPRPLPRSRTVQTAPDDDHDHAEHRDQGGGHHDDAQPDEAAPRYVRCPMLACGRLHELPPDWE